MKVATRRQGSLDLECGVVGKHLIVARKNCLMVVSLKSSRIAVRCHPVWHITEIQGHTMHVIQPDFYYYTVRGGI